MPAEPQPKIKPVVENKAPAWGFQDNAGAAFRVFIFSKSHSQFI